MATINSPRSASPAVPNIVTSPSVTSPSDTPASSVRASLDLPSNTTNRPNAAIPPNQRRNRAALRDYYNLKSKPGVPPGTSPAASTTNLSRSASVTSTTSTSTHLSSATLVTDAGGHGSTSLPSSLDDPSFDADVYIANLLKTSSLRDILRIESSLVSEIRNLDGERKALVYDNYSKLILAVGTIGEMQRGIVDEKNPTLGTGIGNKADSGLTRMKGLESKLDGLMNSFNEQNGLRSDDGAKERQLRADQRRKARDNRRKKELVGWILDAPRRLQAIIDEGRKNDAQTEWTHIESILSGWAGVKGVDDIRDKCMKVLEADDNDGE